MFRFPPTWSVVAGDAVGYFRLWPAQPRYKISGKEEPLAQRVARLRKMYNASRLGDIDNAIDFAHDISSAAFTYRQEMYGTFDTMPLQDLLGKWLQLSRSLLADSGVVADFPDIETSRSLTAFESTVLIDNLIDLQLQLEHEDRIRETFATGMTWYLAELLQHFTPPTAFEGQATSSIAVPLYTFYDLPELIRNLIGPFLRDLLPEDPISALAFRTTRTQIWRNALAVSNLTEEQAAAAPHKIIGPDDCRLSPEKMIDAYLGGTPMRDYISMDVPFVIPRKTYAEHGAIFAKSGHGKTQTLRSILSGFLREDDPPGLFIIDSLGSLIDGVANLAIFQKHLKDRLVIIDPSDPQHTPSLNFFDLQSDDLCFYLFKALDQSFTPRQATMIAYLMEFMRQIPNADLLALIKVCEGKKNPYPEIISKLSPFAASFFENQFYSKHADPLVQQTKNQIAARMYTLARMPKFNQMFSRGSGTTFDPLACMQRKKICLINTDARPPRLGGLGEASSIFGRFILAQCLDAARGRPKENRPLTLLIVDEAKHYMDQQAALILSDARQFGLGMLLATQFPHQLDEGVRKEINTNTSIRMMGPVEYAVASQYARDMFTTPEFIMGMKSYDRSHAEWATYVANLTNSAIKLSVPFGTIEAMERRVETEEPATAAAVSQQLNEMSLRDTDLPLPEQTSATTPRNGSAPSSLNDNGPGAASRLTPEAVALVIAVAAGGMPSAMTQNLKRIAREHGIFVTEETTPDDVIAALMQLSRGSNAGDDDVDHTRPTDQWDQ